MSSNTQIVQGLVSTIIPVYNRPVLLCEAVDSVLNQTYRPIEIIIVDDGSTDQTGAVADEFAAQNPAEILVIHQENTGPGGAREAGRLLAKGEFIQYLDSDDLLMPKKFEMQVAGLKSHLKCGVSYGKTRYYNIGETSKDVPLKRTGERIGMMFSAFLQSRWWSTSTPLFRRTLVDKAGPWENLRNEEDWEYDCRIGSQGVNLHYCDVFVSDTRNHSNGRLSRKGSIEPAKLRDRARAHALIYQHARTAGIDHTVPEMQHFARELFLLSRQCGAAGLAGESKMLFDLARMASGPVRGRNSDFRAYALIASILGWRKTGKMACVLDLLR